MNQNDLINEYINQLANAYKQAMVDNVMLKTQLTLLTKQVEDLTAVQENQKPEKKKKAETPPSDEFSN
jgi:hypothetical protein